MRFKKDGATVAKSAAIYQSYLLRLWFDAKTGHIFIRLERVAKDTQVVHFADAESFLVFLALLIAHLRKH